MSDNLEDIVNLAINAGLGKKEELELGGQHELLKSSHLPLKGDWEVLERWGVVRGNPVNDLFCECVLPEGWKKAPFKHAMWVDLIDSRNLTRAHIYHKATDSKALFYTIKRFSVTCLSALATCWKEYEFYCDRGLVSDDGLSRTVFIGSTVCVGELKGELVAVKDDCVYYFCSDTQDLQPNPDIAIDKVVLLKRSDFSEKYSYIGDYHFVDAVEELAKIDCRSFMSRLPIDDTVWTHECDFPEV